MDGLIIVDKPAGPTSHDIVQRVRKLLGIRRVGHGGTLDPDATGVLLVTVGQATRFFPYLSGHDKSYEGAIRLGFATDTYDSSGRQTSPESLDLPTAEGLARAMKNMEAKVLQTPPAYSAKKVDGTPGYRLARADKEFTLKPVPVHLRVFEALEYRPPLITFRAVCSSGTYIRSLAHDLGKDLGCGAHLHTLRRTSVGPYTLEMANSLVRIEEAAAAGELSSVVLPLENLLPDFPAAVVSPEAVHRIRNGAPISSVHLASGFPEGAGSPPGSALCRLLDGDGRFLALAKFSPDGESLRPFLVVG
jgi:tRNA pseudouridine55 synthase